MFKNLKILILFILITVLLFFSLNKTLFCLLIIFFSFIYFLLNQHLTILLVQLEVLRLGTLLLLAICLISTEKDLIILFTIIVITVIEASIGLSLTVKQARHNSNELLKFYF